jgi:hypothetical protein
MAKVTIGRELTELNNCQTMFILFIRTIKCMQRYRPQFTKPGFHLRHFPEFE